MKTLSICALGLALVGTASAQSTSNFSFDWQTINSSRQLDLKSVNDRGDVFGFYVNPTGPETGFIYNPNTGFQDIAVTNGVSVISKLTASGSVFSYGESPTVQAVFRTQIGGSETQIDLTNGGSLMPHGRITIGAIGDDDRLLFSDSFSHTYLWNPATGTQDLGTNGTFSLGPNGSLININGQSITKIASDGTHTAIARPAGTERFGDIRGYTELASGVQEFTFLVSSSNPFTSYSAFTNYIVPPDHSLLPNYFEQISRTGGGGPGQFSGQTIVALNQNGFAVTQNYGPSPNYISNLDSFNVTNGGTVLTGALISAIDGSSGYLIGNATIPGQSGTSQVYGRYTGEYAHVPEPATFAALGFGALALIRRRKRSK